MTTSAATTTKASDDHAFAGCLMPSLLIASQKHESGMQLATRGSAVTVQLALDRCGESPLELHAPVGHDDELVVVPLQNEAEESSISCDVVTRGVLSVDESHDFLERCVARNHAHARRHRQLC